MVEEKLLLTVVVQIQDIQMMACFLDFLSKEDMNIKVALEHKDTNFKDLFGDCDLKPWKTNNDTTGLNLNVKGLV